MRAVVARGGSLRIEDVAEPCPGPGQVLAAPIVGGICGSDRHALELQAADPDALPPVVLGHEFCVEVLDHGPGTDARVPPGAIVCSIPYADGVDGPELVGFSPNFPGAFGERMVLQQHRLLRVPDGIDPRQAALTEPLAVGFHAVATAALQPGDVALVVGCGPVGLAVIAALKRRGHGPVVAAELSPVRRALAEHAGADVVIDPGATNPYDSWAALGGAPPLPSPLLDDTMPVGHTVVFECVGVPGLLQQVIDAVPQHTRIVVVGVCTVPDLIVPVVAVTKELSLRFVFAYHPREFAAAFWAITEGHVDVAAWVTATFDIAHAPAAMEALADPQHHGKILLSSR